MENWISIDERLPESGQEVLIYYYDKDYEIHQTYIVEYFEKGDIMDTIIPDKYDTPEKNFLDSLLNPENEIRAPEDGFYIYDGSDMKSPYYKHADVITHWQPLPEPPISGTFH
jgi:hypothetical protein